MQSSLFAPRPIGQNPPVPALESDLSPPEHLVLLRLSALGDVTHVVPLVHRLRAAWPDCTLHWIVGGFEARLVGDLPGVTFHRIDKKAGWREIARLRKDMANVQADALLLLGVSMRHNLMSLGVRAKRRIGYDRARAKDLHGLFVRERIAPATGQHVIEAMQSFADLLGAPPIPIRWDIPVSSADIEAAAQLLPDAANTLIISPCSSHRLRNWHAQGYAALAEHAVQAHGLNVALCGGPSRIERDMGDAILAHCEVPVRDLIGKDTLKQAMALFRAARVVVTPDSGPLHMANAVGVPVIGLHAATNPRRSGAFSNLEFAVDAYPEAARRYLGREAPELAWGTRIEREGVMDLISADEVCAMLDRVMARPRSPA